jgi:hypothetical protein
MDIAPVIIVAAIVVVRVGWRLVRTRMRSPARP